MHTSFSISCDIFKILAITIFWKWCDNCIAIYRQTKCGGLVVSCQCCFAIFATSGRNTSLLIFGGGVRMESSPVKSFTFISFPVKSSRRMTSQSWCPKPSKNIRTVQKVNIVWLHWIVDLVIPVIRILLLVGYNRIVLQILTLIGCKWIKVLTVFTQSMEQLSPKLLNTKQV